MIAWNTLGGFFDVAAKRNQLTEFEGRMTQPGFWDRQSEAQSIVTAVSGLKAVLEPFARVSSRVEDFCVMGEIATEEGAGSSMLAEAEHAWPALEADLEKVEMTSFLSGKFDRKNAIFSIHAGSGGTESCDWTDMLFRMFTRYFQRRGWTFDVLDIQPGDEAGLKSVSMIVTGECAYGYCKSERGVHRLVRISPFDANKRRHTSFSAVDVLAEIDDDIVVDIKEEDLRVDTYRSSGAGGQHVNKTDSAVRITHLPTGFTAQCQNERSQHANRRTAMNILRAKLHELQRQEQDKEISGLRGERGDIAFANQIRSYVMQPYTMVKDHRTDVETADVAGVLNGDLDSFIRSYLQAQAGKSGE